jgi:hypothetical protein
VCVFVCVGGCRVCLCPPYALKSAADRTLTLPVCTLQKHRRVTEDIRITEAKSNASETRELFVTDTQYNSRVLYSQG